MDRKCQLCRLVPLKIMNLCEIIEQTPERQYITWAWQHGSVLKSEASLLDMLLNKTIIIIIFYIWWNCLPSVEKWQDQASANVWKQSLGRILDVESWSFLMFGWAWGSAGTIAGLQEWLVGRDERQTDGQAVLSQAPRQCAPANAQWAEQRRVGKQELKNVWVTWWEASARAVCTQQCKAGQHLLSVSWLSHLCCVLLSLLHLSSTRPWTRDSHECHQLLFLHSQDWSMYSWLSNRLGAPEQLHALGLCPPCDLDKSLASYCPALVTHSASVQSCFTPQRRNLPLVAF